jgi:hypothetical protein
MTARTIPRRLPCVACLPTASLVGRDHPAHGPTPGGAILRNCAAGQLFGEVT